MKKLVLFDCDETLWHSENKDYISSLPGPFSLQGPNTLVRNDDQKVFQLGPRVREAFRILYAQCSIGIVSDNKPQSVLEALRLFGLTEFINKQAQNIRLWDGYCPKDEMVKEILARELFTHLEPRDVYWFDDKDYSAVAGVLSVNFCLVESTEDTVDQLITNNLIPKF